MVGSISSIGIGSGLDMQGIIDQLREVDDKALIKPKEKQISGFEAQLEEFTVVKNKLFSMKSAALDLSLSGTFISRSVSNSDDDVLEATVSDGATVQSVNVVVTGIASKSSWLSSSGLSSADANIAAVADTFVYAVDGESISVSVAAGTSLSELVDLINEDADNPGVTASIINDGGSNPYKLLLKADGTGEEKRISIGAAGQIDGLPLVEQNGSGGSSLNARISVDGISYQRQDNSFSDVLSGVTIKLKGAGASSVSVSSNTDSVKTTITDLVTAFNDLVQEVSANVAYDEEKDSFGVLAGTTLRNLPYDLQNLMTRTVEADDDGKVLTMFDLGLEFNRDGAISIDAEVLDSMLADYPESVEAFFLGDADEGVTGFADNINERLRVLTSGNGQVEAEKSSAQDRIDALKLQITTDTDRMSKKYEILTKQFIELDRYMKQMTSISSYLTSQFSSLSQTGSK